MFDYRKVAIAARLSSIFGIWPTLVIFTTPIITYQEPVGSICSLQFLVAHYLLGPSSISRVTLRWKNTQTLPESFQTFKIQFREFPSSHTTSYSGSNRIFSHRSSCKIHIQICWIHATFMQVASNCPPSVDSLASVRSELFSNSDAKNDMPNLQTGILICFFCPLGDAKHTITVLYVPNIMTIFQRPTLPTLIVKLD